MRDRLAVSDTERDPLHGASRTVLDLEDRYGRPSVWTARFRVSPEEFAMVRSSTGGWRSHDVTFCVVAEDRRIAVIRKPFHPAGVFRIPSGGVKPGEDFDAGVRREAWEELGIDVALRRYLLRAEVVFEWEGREQPWTTHVITARGGGPLAPRDTTEIAEARWMELAELQGPVRAALRRSGRGLLRYRAELTDRVAELLRPDGPLRGAAT